MDSPSLNETMLAYAEDAVAFASQQFGITLDYSHDSIQQTEKIAEAMFKTIPSGFLGKLFQRGPSEEELDQFCKMLGGYIGEVYRRNRGGDWAINEEFSAVGIQRGESWIFPPSKVYKRLTNGKEDDLWFYFQVMLKQE
jgi:hypothetical protein